VEYLRFDAFDEGGAVMLVWTTVSENNSLGFIVERMSTGETGFTRLTFVASRQSHGILKAYEYLDADPPDDGDLIYRLKQVDYNGDFTYSPTVLVKRMPSETASLRCSPNPFSGFTDIVYTLDCRTAGNYFLIVYDGLGRPVRILKQSTPVGPGMHTARFDAKGLPAGIYVCLLSAPGGVVSRRLSLIR
jgi:hypothetical protein